MTNLISLISFKTKKITTLATQIATSNGSASSLDNTSGGRCLTHNMRVAITVCPASQKCIKDDTLCKTPKTVELPTTTTTTTTTIPPPSSEPSTISTTEKSGGKGDEEPKVQAQHRGMNDLTSEKIIEVTNV